MPTAVAAIRVYAYASAVRTLGTALMSDPHQGIQEVVTRGLGRMASADPIGEWIAGEVLGLVAKQVEGPNPCNG